MATAVKRAVAIDKTPEKEVIVNFSPEALKAPFFLRCSAAFIDYILLIALPVGWLMLSSFFSEHGDVSIGPTVWLIAGLCFLINFVVLPLVRGQTIGKFLLGLTILNYDGNRPRLGRLLIRNILGYLLTFATFGLGFAIAALNTSGRALHDFVAGTTVVRGRKLPK